MENKYCQYICDELNKFGKKYGAYLLATTYGRNIKTVMAQAANSRNQRIIIIRKENIV